MSIVRVTFTYEPEPEDADDDDGCGLTEDAYLRLLDQLTDMGADETTVSRADL